jgi:hypothetical protein
MKGLLFPTEFGQLQSKASNHFRANLSPQTQTRNGNITQLSKSQAAREPAATQEWARKLQRFQRLATALPRPALFDSIKSRCRRRRMAVNILATLSSTVSRSVRHSTSGEVGVS